MQTPQRTIRQGFTRRWVGFASLRTSRRWVGFASLRTSLRWVGFASLRTAWLPLALFFVACGSHPEENSGGDAYRNEAQPMPLDEWVTGELDRDNGDTTDWKQVSVDGGKLTVELKADKKGASIRVEVYDKHGLSIGVGAAGSKEDSLAVPVNAKGGGKLFVRVEHRGGPKTAYSVRAAADGGGDDGGPDL